MVQSYALNVYISTFVLTARPKCCVLFQDVFFTQIINVFSMSTISGHLSAGDGLLNFHVPGHPSH